MRRHFTAAELDAMSESVADQIRQAQSAGSMGNTERAKQQYKHSAGVQAGQTLMALGRLLTPLGRTRRLLLAWLRRVIWRFESGMLSKYETATNETDGTARSVLSGLRIMLQRVEDLK